MSDDGTVSRSDDLYGTFPGPDQHPALDSAFKPVANGKTPAMHSEDRLSDDLDALYNSLEDSVNKTSLDAEPLDDGSLNDGSLNNLMNLSTSSLGSSRWYKHVTVEPVILLFSLAMTLTGPVTTALYLEHTCVSVLGFNQTYCKELEGTTDQTLEAIVQPKANMYMMAATMVETCVPAVLTLFVGPWSDVHGRKTFLVLPILGYFLKYSTYFAFSFFPTLPPAYLLLASVPVSLAGGLVSMISLSYCYITDVTSEQRRGFRMGIVEAGFYTGLLAGTAASTYLFNAGGYVSVYATSAALCFVTLVYGAFVLDESISNAEPVKCLSSLFDLRLVKEMLSTCCKKRDYGRRAIIFLVVAAVASCVFTMEGDTGVQFLFTRKKFAWDIKDYTTFASVSILLQIVGTLLGVSVLSAWLGLDDGLLALVSFALKIVSSILLALSPAGWWMYVSSGVGMFGAFAGPLCRAVLSKAVDHQDVGKVFSLLSAMEAITPLAAVPLYTLLYNATLSTFPGAFYLVTGAIFLLDFVLLGAVVIIQRVLPVPVYTGLTTE